MGGQQRIRIKGVLDFLSTRFWGGFDNVFTAAIFLAAIALATWAWNEHQSLVITGVAVAVLCGLVAGFYIRRLRRALTTANDALSKAEILADSQLNFTINLAGYIRVRSQPSASVQPTFETFLRDFTEVFAGTVCRASLWLPNSTLSALECFAQYQMPPTSIVTDRFPLDARFNTVPSIAAHTYLRRELLIVHLFKVTGEWTSDYPTLYEFSIDNKTPPPYRAFASIPIMDRRRTCLGVFCIDSTEEGTFDGEGISDLLYDVGVFLASGLVIDRTITATSVVPLVSLAPTPAAHVNTSGSPANSSQNKGRANTRGGNTRGGNTRSSNKGNTSSGRRHH